MRMEKYNNRYKQFLDKLDTQLDSEEVKRVDSELLRKYEVEPKFFSKIPRKKWIESF